MATSRWFVNGRSFRFSLERIEREDGGPLRYRVRHRARIWRRGERPRVELQVVEGDPELSSD